MREKQGLQAAKEAEELRKMLEGMTIKHDREQEEVKKRFEERSKKLWDVSGNVPVPSAALGSRIETGYQRGHRCS